MSQDDKFKKLVAHCKEYGFIFQSSELYDGLGAVYDYGPNGSELKNNIKNYWWKSMVQMHENIVGIDAAIFMHPKTWKASGHVDAFNDPLIDNKDSKKDIVQMFWWKIIWIKSKLKSIKKLQKQKNALVMLLMKRNFDQRIQGFWQMLKKWKLLQSDWQLQ